MAPAAKPMTVVALCLAGALSAFSAGALAATTPQGVAAEAKPPPLPLKTTRTIAFDTDEGTWLSLDVSPDGSLIVFELLGDIYTLPISGGEAKLVLGGNAWDSQPRFSPDGKRIVFVSDRDGAQNIWTAGIDGADLRQITKDTQGDVVSPAFTPDGRFVMAARDSDVFGGRELWLYDIGGGAGLQVTKASPAPKTPPDEQLNIAGATASPDGRYVYYAQRHGLMPYNVLSTLADRAA
jgi:Tol biopolymer transport system component